VLTVRSRISRSLSSGPPKAGPVGSKSEGSGQCFAGVRNVAFGAAIVMAVMVAEQAWAVLFLNAPPPFCDGDYTKGTSCCLFDCDYTIGTSSYTESLIGVAVMIWLVGHTVTRALKSIAVDR
jgi:hypothetical protein